MPTKRPKARANAVSKLARKVRKGRTAYLSDTSNYTQTFRTTAQLHRKGTRTLLKTPKPLHMPNEAGEWLWTHPDKDPMLQLEKWMFFGYPCENYFSRQDYLAPHPFTVTVTETPSSGRMCRELKMGGSIHCGLNPWSGQWEKAL